MKSISKSKHPIAPGDIPRSVWRIMATLNDHGYDAKIVGGCIRDLLLDQKPKDFDVVTDAKPNQIKGLFPRSRIIGRRFKLVHVRSGRNITEVSTYRRSANHPGKSPNHRQLNLYGSVEEDFPTRDFTVNALYYDGKTKEIFDFVGGLKHIEQRVLQCIGNPRDRFAEDPCRILRAVRFAAKLPLVLDSELEQAINETHSLISHLKPARLHNELEKMFLFGNALSSYRALQARGLLRTLFPQSCDNDSLALAAMQSTDSRHREGKPIKLGFLIAAIHWEQFRKLGKYDAAGRMSIANAIESADNIIKRQREVLSMPKHIREFVQDIWILQTQIERRRPKRVRDLLTHARFRAAYDLLVLRASVGDADPGMAKWWTDLQEMDEQQQDAAIAEVNRRSKRKQSRQSGSVTAPSVATTH